MDPLKLTPSRCKLQEGVAGQYGKSSFIEEVGRQASSW